MKGNLPAFIDNFLLNRIIKVRFEEFISESVKFDNGLPQGSVLNLLLFFLIINSIFEECEDIDKSLFCDDGKFSATVDTLEEAVVNLEKH